MARHKLRAWEKRLPAAPRRSDVLRGIILRHICFREARPVPVIYDYVVNDFGTVSDRAIYRHLRSMLDDGVIIRVQDDLEDTWGYVRTRPSYWDNRERVYV